MSAGRTLLFPSAVVKVAEQPRCLHLLLENSKQGAHLSGEVSACLPMVNLWYLPPEIVNNSITLNPGQQGEQP